MVLEPLQPNSFPLIILTQGKQKIYSVEFYVCNFHWEAAFNFIYVQESLESFSGENYNSFPGKELKLHQNVAT